MRVARAPAVGVVGALREEGAEDAVLHVEERHVLVERELKPGRGCRPQQRGHLLGVQIIADSHSLQSLVRDEPIGRQRVSHVE